MSDKLDSSERIDEISKVPLCHITLLCKDLICEGNNCTDCTEWVSTPTCDSCRLKFAYESTQLVNKSLKLVLSGSFNEGTNMPAFQIENISGVKHWKRSDLDYMYDIGLTVGFDPIIDTDVSAIADMDNSPPGYLRLKRTGELVLYPSNGNPFKQHLGPEKYSSSSVEFIPHGPASKATHSYAERPKTDFVLSWSCPKFPPCAQAWIHRERKWPSPEIIQEIISKGCHIVHKSYKSFEEKNDKNEDGENKESEYRFSFSIAEARGLFESLSSEQKQCFIAFKALVKYTMYKIKSADAKKLTTYHLKNIFLYTCETIPADRWQTTDGWAGCLLYLIDQLSICLNEEKMAGYFVPEYNLLDIFTPSQLKLLSDEVKTLRKNPMMHAATLLDSMEWFHLSYSKVTDELKILNSSSGKKKKKMKEKMGSTFSSTQLKPWKGWLEQQLLFLQKIVGKTEMTRSVAFWKKTCMLRVFARWCKQNSRKIQLRPWQCLPKQMTLFDVIYLDIVHEFDVPSDVLLQHIDQESSPALVCKLAICYTTHRRETHQCNENKVTNSIHSKTLLIFKESLRVHQFTVESIIICLSFLLNCEQFETVMHVLETAEEQFIESDEKVFCESHGLNVFSDRISNEIQDAIEICRKANNYVPVRVAFYYLLSKCYKGLGKTERLEGTLKQLAKTCFKLREYLSLLLLFDACDIESQSEIIIDLRHETYVKVLKQKKLLIGCESKLRKVRLVKESNENEGFNRTDMIEQILFEVPSKGYNSRHDAFFISGNCFLNGLILWYGLDDVKKSTLNEEGFDGFVSVEKCLSELCNTSADKVYYCQYLVNRGKTEEAIPFLENVVEVEGDCLLSMVIWPKQLKKMVDEKMQTRLEEADERYIVYPTAVYARYLLKVARGKI